MLLHKKSILGLILLSSFTFADGLAIYTKCIGCHGSDGEIKALGKPTVLQNASKEEIHKKLLGYKEGTINKYGMGMLMRSQVNSLSEDEIDELASYISTFKSPQ
jgi:cytochrome c553